jgi:hypothetical protein
MAEDVLYRFPWGTLDKPRSDRALREALQAMFGAKIEAEDPSSPSEEAAPDDIDYEVAIPARFAEDRHRPGDAPLPPPQDGLFTGVYTLRADEEGALLTLPWRDNAHVWGIMTDLVDTVAKTLGGWREGDAEETTDPSIPRLPSNPPPPAPAPIQRESHPPPTSSPATIPRASRIPTQQGVAPAIAHPATPPPSVEPSPNTKPSVMPPPGEADDLVQIPEEPGEELDDQDDERVFPSWESLKAWVAEAYTLEEDDGASFAVTMTWSATPRKQLVRIAKNVVHDETWITFRSGVCRRGRLSAEQALRRSSELPFARIVAEKDRYDLVYSFPLPGLTIGRFTDLLENVAELADDLENEITRGGDEF